MRSWEGALGSPGLEALILGWGGKTQAKTLGQPPPAGGSQAQRGIFPTSLSAPPPKGILITQGDRRGVWAPQALGAELHWSQYILELGLVDAGQEPAGDVGVGGPA